MRFKGLVGGVVVSVFALLLAGCGGAEGGGFEGLAEEPPASPEEAGSVMVRVSGTEGTAFTGDYGTIDIGGTLQTVDDTLSNEPIEYEVDVVEGVSDGVTATFQKTQPGTEGLGVEIVADGEVVVESRTVTDLGVVTADWFPQIEPLGGLPEDGEILEDEPLPDEPEQK